MKRLEALIHINSIQKIGAVKLKKLLEKFESAKKIITTSISNLMQSEGISRNIAESIVNFSKEEIDKEIGLIKQEKISVIDFGKEKYPENLKNIYSPPILLYVKGDLLESDKNAIAIVGSRRATYYGLSTAERLAYKLASMGITVVSGMARGIDAAAHKGALKAGGRTIAVLGSGINHIYPPENKKLSNRISGAGAVISEFPMETAPLRQNFPKRNRIISGLSKGVIVVEAAKRSGSLITADFALEQGREVFAVPGKVRSVNSKGTHGLIKQGAKLVDNVEDILEELNLSPKPINITEQERINSNKIGADEKKMVSFLQDEPMHIDVLSNKSGLEISELLAVLVKLQVKGVVKELPGKKFIRSNINPHYS